jgi:hypothetical protein
MADTMGYHFKHLLAGSAAIVPMRMALLRIANDEALPTPARFAAAQALDSARTSYVRSCERLGIEAGGPDEPR